MRVRERFRGRSRSRFTASSDQAMMPAKRAVEEEAFSDAEKNDAREKKKKDTTETKTDDEVFLVRGGVGTVRARRMVDSSGSPMARVCAKGCDATGTRCFAEPRRARRDEARNVALAAGESRPTCS